MEEGVEDWNGAGEGRDLEALGEGEGLEFEDKNRNLLGEGEG